ncbi:MAG TPA: glycosyltransferase family 4 protein [Glaciihabitans sp.]|nr:glycosyltransferase family 4 protein [Glaciihabitans sp.]
MRIGMIAPPWLTVPPSGYGGIEAVVDVLSCALLEAGHDVVLAAAGDSACPVPRVQGMPLSDPSQVGASASELRHAVRAYAAFEDVDVIHDHTLVGPHLRRRPDRVPVVTTAHNRFTPDLLDVYRARPVDVSVVAISHHQATTARGVQISRVIHHGLSTATIPRGAGGDYACFLGRMSPDKGVREAIMIAQRAGIPLRIAARMREPGEIEYFETVIAPLLNRDVVLVGELSAHEKYKLLGSALALLNPIQWDEPFGMVMLEALATGTPIIATRRASVPEIVEDTVTGFIGDTIEELALGLRRAAELDRMRCRESVATRFGPSLMAARYLALYQACLATRVSSPVRH